MSYSVREIAKKYDLSPHSVYIAARSGNIQEVENSSPKRYTKLSVDRYWSRRDPQTDFKKPQDYMERLDALEKRIEVLEKLNGL